MVSGQWSVVSGQWSVVSGQWSVVSGQWSVVSGQWSVVTGHWSVVSSPDPRGNFLEINQLIYIPDAARLASNRGPGLHYKHSMLPFDKTWSLHLFVPNLPTQR